ncbi:hypothetical protein HMPREF0308_2316 [Corynebacterium striatum ATCC 6940]|nr:hypothetical protein HMPREF0308_2316 [Corynebacterium striatum ATCC 6940]
MLGDLTIYSSPSRPHHLAATTVQHKDASKKRWHSRIAARANPPG